MLPLLFGLGFSSFVCILLPWLFLLHLHFITLCYPFLKLPPQVSWLLISVGVPVSSMLSPPAAGGGMAIACPGSK